MLHGVSGPIKVNGTVYNPTADMPGFYANTQIDDRMLADIATYIRHEWSNAAGQVDEKKVAEIRKATESRAGKPYTPEELKDK